MVAVPDVANIITRDAQDHHITREVQVERKHRAVASRRLAARATAAASAKTKRLHAEARSLLSLIARRKKEITEAFYDIGEALTRLKSRDLVSALGRATFAEVCTLDAGISAATAERLVAIATTMTREQALAMGQKKAMAMITLAAATPEDDTAVGLYRRKSVALPGGKNVSPRSASANAIEEAATAIRHQRRAVAPPPPPSPVAAAPRPTRSARSPRSSSAASTSSASSARSSPRSPPSPARAPTCASSTSRPPTSTSY